MQIILFGCKNRGFADGKVAEMEEGHGIEGLTGNTGKKKVRRCQVSCTGNAVDSGNHPCSV